MSQIRNSSLACVIFVLAVFGCADSVTPSNAQNDAEDQIQDRNSDAARQLRQKAFDRKSFDRVEPQDAAPVTGEVPDDLLQKIFTDLESRTSGSQTDFELLRAEAVRWSDGALGCPEPGTMYQQVQVDGYRVVIRFQEKEYDYRASDRGFFMICPGLPLKNRENPRQKNGAPVEAPKF